MIKNYVLNGEFENGSNTSQYWELKNGNINITETSFDLTSIKDGAVYTNPIIITNLYKDLSNEKKSLYYTLYIKYKINDGAVQEFCFTKKTPYLYNGDITNSNLGYLFVDTDGDKLKLEVRNLNDSNTKPFKISLLKICYVNGKYTKDNFPDVVSAYDDYIKKDGIIDVSGYSNKFNFYVKTQTTNDTTKTYGRNIISVTNQNEYGHHVAVGSGQRLILGSGESAAQVIENDAEKALLLNTGSETLHLVSDQQIMLTPGYNNDDIDESKNKSWILSENGNMWALPLAGTTDRLLYVNNNGTIGVPSDSTIRSMISKATSFCPGDTLDCHGIICTGFVTGSMCDFRFFVPLPKPIHSSVGSITLNTDASVQARCQGKYLNGNTSDATKLTSICKNGKPSINIRKAAGGFEVYVQRYSDSKLTTKEAIPDATNNTSVAVYLADNWTITFG